MYLEKVKRVAKLLNLARSVEQHEAMSAIRKASEMVGCDWEAFFATLSVLQLGGPFLHCRNWVSSVGDQTAVSMADLVPINAAQFEGRV